MNIRYFFFLTGDLEIPKQSWFVENIRNCLVCGSKYQTGCMLENLSQCHYMNKSICCRIQLSKNRHEVDGFSFLNIESSKYTFNAAYDQSKAWK